MPDYTDQNLDKEQVIQTKEKFIRLVNFFLAKIEKLPLYSEEIEAFQTNIKNKQEAKIEQQENLENDAVLADIVTFEYYFYCQDRKDILEKLKDTLNYLIINLITKHDYSIRDSIDQNCDCNGVHLKKDLN